MKRIYEFLGTFIVKTVGIGVIVACTLFLTTLYVEKDREEIFFHAMDYFNDFFEYEKEAIYEENGLLDFQEVNQSKNELKRI